MEANIWTDEGLQVLFCAQHQTERTNLFHKFPSQYTNNMNYAWIYSDAYILLLNRFCQIFF